MRSASPNRAADAHVGVDYDGEDEVEDEDEEEHGVYYRVGLRLGGLPHSSRRVRIHTADRPVRPRLCRNVGGNDARQTVAAGRGSVSSASSMNFKMRRHNEF